MECGKAHGHVPIADGYVDKKHLQQLLNPIVFAQATQLLIKL